MSVVSIKSMANVLNLRVERLVFSNCQMLSAQLSFQQPWERPSGTTSSPNTTWPGRGLNISLKLLDSRVMTPRSSWFGVASE